MTQLSKLSRWKRLTKEEQVRLKGIVQPDYENVEGRLSVSSQELKKARQAK